MSARVVIVGGGYAGLACALELHRDCHGVEVTVLDPGPRHIKATLLHQTVRRDIAHICEPFDDLAERFGFAYEQGRAGDAAGCFDSADVARWAADGFLTTTAGTDLPFDYLVLATGTRPAPAADAPNCVDRLRMSGESTVDLLDEHLWPMAADARIATVVGGGASGVQIAFELAELMRRTQRRGQVRLVDLAPRLFEALPPRVHRYVLRRMREANIDYVAESRYVATEPETVRVQSAGGDSVELPSAVTFLFAGNAQHPERLNANRFGQLQTDSGVLENVFAAGDCSRFAGTGLNAQTAQAAVRKGKQVAVNISRLVRRRGPIAYRFSELGYVISLGALDAVGWAVTPGNVLTGLAAFGARELVDAQYDLFVHGVDTYLV